MSAHAEVERGRVAVLLEVRVVGRRSGAQHAPSQVEAFVRRQLHHLETVGHSSEATRRPITTIRSAMVRASLSSCVTWMAVVPSGLQERSRPRRRAGRGGRGRARRAARRAAARVATGPASAPARRAGPPRPTAWPPAGARSRAGRRGRAARRPAPLIAAAAVVLHAQAEGHVGADVLVREQLEVLEHQADAAAVRRHAGEVARRPNAHGRRRACGARRSPAAACSCRDPLGPSKATISPVATVRRHAVEHRSRRRSAR